MNQKTCGKNKQQTYSVTFLQGQQKTPEVFKTEPLSKQIFEPSAVAPPITPPELAPQPMASRRIKAPFFSAPWFVEISMMPLHQKTTKVIGSKKTLGSISSCVFFVHPSKAITICTWSLILLLIKYTGKYWSKSANVFEYQAITLQHART